jgi:hypothetical protein
MKIFLKLAIGKIFSGLSWLLQSFIEHWKVWTIIATVGYVLYLHFQVRDLSVENQNLSDTVFRQDSTIVAVRSKYMVDSVNLGLREISMQNTVKQVNDENKSLKSTVAEQKQLIKDLADGIKCKNIFGKIVNCKKKD